MESITLTRVVGAPASAVREEIRDVEAFMRAGGFTDVTVDGSRLHITNRLGLATLELDCELVDTDHVLSYEQRDGIFESMETHYDLNEVEEGTEVRATTDFAVDVGFVGEILDATVVKRQRRKELTAQFDYLEEKLGGG